MKLQIDLTEMMGKEMKEKINKAPFVAAHTCSQTDTGVGAV